MGRALLSGEFNFCVPCSESSEVLQYSATAAEDVEKVSFAFLGVSLIDFPCFSELSPSWRVISRMTEAFCFTIINVSL